MINSVAWTITDKFLRFEREAGGPFGISHLLGLTKDGRGQLWAIVKLSQGEHEEMFLSKWVPKIP